MGWQRVRLEEDGKNGFPGQHQQDQQQLLLLSVDPYWSKYLLVAPCARHDILVGKFIPTCPPS
jgi:hypothetical protein